MNKLYLLLISLVAALGGLLFGFDTAIISGTIPFIQPYFSLSEIGLGWVVGSLIIGCIIGAAFAGKLADKMGRKKVLIITSFFFIVSTFGTALASSLSLFVVSRILGGVAVGAASIVSPLYIAEISPSKIRGTMVSLNQLTITIGILVSYLINYFLVDWDNNWRWMFFSGIIPSVLFFVLLFFVPESPRWLVKNNLKEKGLAILERVGGKQNALLEMNQISKSLTEKQGLFKDLFKKGTRKALMIGVALSFFMQITGITVVIYYAPVILQKSNMGVSDSLFQTSFIGLINFLFTFVAIWLVDKIGRRPLFITGALGMTLTLTALTIAFITGRTEGLIILFIILAYIAFFASCMGPVFWVLISEIFPNSLRGTAMSVAIFVVWLTNFVGVFIFPWMLENLGGGYTFMFYAVMSLLMLIFSIKYFPETKGKTLEEIEKYWK